MPHKPTSPHITALCVLLAVAANTSAAEVSAQTAAAPSLDLLVTVTDTPELGPSDTGKGTYLPGTDVIYTVVVRNRGTLGVKGVTVSAPLPAGITQASWVCANSKGSVCGASSGTGAILDRIDLAPHALVTYLATLSVPAEYASTQPRLVFSVAVTPPPDVMDVAASNLTATDTDTVRPAASTMPLLPPPGSAGGTGVSTSRGQPQLGTIGGHLGAAPFVCDSTMYASVGATGTSPTDLLIINTTSNPFSSTKLGTASIAYNGMGFNPIDNFLYAFKNGTNQLYQIHSDGSATLVGTPTGLPSPANGYTSGEISPSGVMYVKEQNDTKTLYTIDLTVTPLKAKTLTISQSLLGTADLAWINGLLYGVLVDMNADTATVATVDPNTGATTYLPFVNRGITNNIGALFGSSSGLFGIENSGTGNSGTFLEFDLNSGQATKLGTTTFAVGSSDGAHCASAPVTFTTDLLVTKTDNKTTYTPGVNNTYTIVVTNNGPTGVQNAPVNDPLPAGITTGSWTCTTSGTGVCGATSGTGGIVDKVNLGVGDTVTYLLTLTVPANYAVTHPNLTNIVTVSMPPGFIAVNPTHLTAGDVDTAGVDIGVLKTTSSNSVAVGDTLTYTITAINPGTADVTNAILTDVPDSRLDCVSPGPTVPCTAAGGAVCPNPTATVANLLGTGVTIPNLPVGGTAVFSLTCKVTQATAIAAKPTKK